MPPVPSMPVPVARTTARHRREVLWQIALPMFLAGAGGIGLMYLSAAGAEVPRAALADVSLIYLSVPALAAGLVLLLALIGACTLLVVALRELPPVLRRGLDYARLAAARTRAVADRINGSLTSARNLLATLRSAADEVRSTLGGLRDE